MGLTDKHLAYGDDIPQTQAEKDYYWELKHLEEKNDKIEQEQCKDKNCISRQAVDELSKQLVHTTRDKADFLCDFWEGLQKLPSVTPKEKIIHCKDCKYRDYWGDCTKWSKELDAHKSYILDENMFCGFAEIKDGERMTREEAIADIRDNIKPVVGGISLDMAIEALEQQPCEDWYDVPSNEMTLEQARQAVKDLRKKLAEYLEQQPCEDCVSRKDMLAVLRQSHSLTQVWEGFEKLPSVTPQPKMGRWIRQTDDYHDYYECEHCGIAVGLDDIKNFCPNCGARMVSE